MKGAPMTQTEHKQSFSELPWYKCEGLFCSAYAPFVDKRILIRGVPEIRVIGWCSDCGRKRGRYICTKCALPESISDVESGWQRLVCRYCGTPLGKVKEVFWLSEMEVAAFDSAEISQLSPDEISPIPDGAWWALYQHAIRSGLIETTGIQQALLARDGGDNSRALVLFDEELNRCRSADYQVGIGRCLLEKGMLLLAADRTYEALEHVNEAEPLLRECGNDKLLRECLGYRMWLQKTTLAPPDERLTVLNEVIKLYRETQAQGMIQYDQAIELFTKERIALYLESNNLVDAMPDLRRLPQAATLLRQMADQLHQRNQQKNRLPKHAAEVKWDEDLLDQLRTAQDAWGCPRGCKPPGTYGIVSMPRGTDGSRMPCLLCGTQYILLNNYYELTASVPDFMDSRLVEADYLTSVPLDTVEVFNHSLVLRESGDIEPADRLQQLVIAELEDLLGCHSPEFALALGLLGGSLLFRDEHDPALSLFQRAVQICEQSQESHSELLAKCLNNMGISLACLRNLQKAEEVLRRACELKPDFPNPHYWLAKLYAKREKSEDSELEEAAWQSYIDRTPTSLSKGEEAFSRLIGFASKRCNSKRIDDLQQQLQGFRKMYIE